MAVLDGVGASHSPLLLGLGKSLSCHTETSRMEGTSYACGGWKRMKMWRLKIRVLVEEFMHTMNGACTCTTPCTGVQPPQMYHPYAKTAQA